MRAVVFGEVTLPAELERYIVARVARGPELIAALQKLRRDGTDELVILVAGRDRWAQLALTVCEGDEIDEPTPIVVQVKAGRKVRLSKLRRLRHSLSIRSEPYALPI